MSDTNIPEDLSYTEEHEWVSQDSEICTVGITDYAQSELGDIVFVELPEVGESVKQGQPFGTIEAVKTVSDLFAPVSGEVVEINQSLEESAEQVNNDPYGDGWIIKLRLEDQHDLAELLSPKDYADVLSNV
jgi:glycine cleavage system H protein